MFAKKKDYVLLSCLLSCPKTGCRSVNSFAPPSFFAHEAKHNSGTTLLRHVVTSLHSLFRYSVARAVNPLNSLSTPCMFFKPCVRLNRVLGAGGVVREAGTLPCLFHCFHLGSHFFHAWDLKVCSHRSVVASHIDHVVCLEISAVPHASPVNQDVVQLLVSPAR